MEETAKWEKDYLTSCFTRSSLFPFLEKLQMESRLINKTFSVMVIDLDHFKPLNDKYGHTFGDDALKYFSSTMRLSLEGDYMKTMVQQFLFRYGGDEFVIVFPDNTSPEAYKIAAKLLYNVRKRYFLFMGRSFNISFSAGIASCPGDANTAQETLECADKAMYFSKKNGKGRVTQYKEIYLEKIKRLISTFFMVVVVIAVIAGGVFLVAKIFNNSNFVNSIKNMNKTKTTEVKKTSRSESNNLAAPKFHIIYLKSGGIVKGVIVSDGDPMEVKLFLGKGEGSIFLKKSEVSKIDPPN